MKKNLHISALIDQPELMENMVEKLACKNTDIGYAKASITGEWQAVDTSSVEKYVTGTLEVEFDNETVQIPFVSSFIFSCTKDENHPYRLNWSMSLS
ncbi:MAG: hypothetical protein ACJ75B_15170 [Flavisolibacter sp.]